VLADERLDEQGFLTAGTRLACRRVPSISRRHGSMILPTPFAVVGGGLPAHVVAAGRGGQWTVLDVVEGRVWQMTSADVRTLGARALTLREKLTRERGVEWYAPCGHACGRSCQARHGVAADQPARPGDAALHDARAQSRDRPRRAASVAPMMAMLSAACSAFTRSISRSGWRAAGCRPAPAHGSTR